MAGSGTSLWPSLTPGNRARASEVEYKFDWLEANILPMLSGSTTDLAYDLGSASVRWRGLWAGSINPTTTANAIVLGTTTAVTAGALNSDVSIELAGPKALLLNRVTSTQRTNLTGLNGMVVYDTTVNQFYVYENSTWKVMVGAPIGFVFPLFASVTSAVTTSVLSITAGGRIRRITLQGAVAAGAASIEMTIDSVKYGDVLNQTTTIGFLTLSPTTTANTAGVFYFDSATVAGPTRDVDVFFKSSLDVYLRSNGIGAEQIGVWYERT